VGQSYSDEPANNLRARGEIGLVAPEIVYLFGKFIIDADADGFMLGSHTVTLACGRRLPNGVRINPLAVPVTE
jgi:hypothetical protein